jgi:hypothetical protein
MSGGHFDYAYMRAVQFADELERDLREPKEWLGDFKPETIQELHGVVTQVRRTASIMKEVEWLFSGDSGEDTFLAELKAI